jgi:hypothetical protein
LIDLATSTTPAIGYDSNSGRFNEGVKVDIPSYQQKGEQGAARPGLYEY